MSTVFAFPIRPVHAVCAMALVALCSAVPVLAAGEGEPAFSPFVSESGSIKRPDEARTHWVHLGTWALTDSFHDVYTQPGSVEAYRRDGKFPDGAVLVKEIRKSESGKKTTGQVSWAGSEIVQWFVMIKDSKGRFPDNPLWGDGWGWALYMADAPSKNVATDYKIDCIGCHIPAKATDWVYMEGYPTLEQ
jgi:hypothetical protein